MESSDTKREFLKVYLQIETLCWSLFVSFEGVPAAIVSQDGK